MRVIPDLRSSRVNPCIRDVELPVTGIDFKLLHGLAERQQQPCAVRRAVAADLSRTFDRSPAIYRWDLKTRTYRSPGGTTETTHGRSIQSSLRDFPYPNRPNPAINRWAPLKCPSGAKTGLQRNHLPHPAAHPALHLRPVRKASPYPSLNQRFRSARRQRVLQKGKAVLSSGSKRRSHMGQWRRLITGSHTFNRYFFS